MTSFLNHGLECLMHLYEEACGLNKMLEVKLKKAEVTIADQGMIAAVKSLHYKGKFKAMTQEHQAAMKKSAHEAQAKLDAVQARLKMAYEAKVAGFEFPTWTIEAWETKLKDLCGAPVEYPVKPTVGEPSKAVEMATEASGDAEKVAGADLGQDAGGEGDAAVEGVAA
ncbi:hypothetical protein Hanom_Chr16g01442261 [Helianthus anomalus]